MIRACSPCSSRVSGCFDKSTQWVIGENRHFVFDLTANSDSNSAARRSRARQWSPAKSSWRSRIMNLPARRRRLRRKPLHRGNRPLNNPAYVRSSSLSQHPQNPQLTVYRDVTLSNIQLQAPASSLQAEVQRKAARNSRASLQVCQYCPARGRQCTSKS
jgi:hypothetical protein